MFNLLFGILQINPLYEVQWILFQRPEDEDKTTQSFRSPEGSPVFQLTKETGLSFNQCHFPGHQIKPAKAQVKNNPFYVPLLSMKCLSLLSLCYTRTNGFYNFHQARC